MATILEEQTRLKELTDRREQIVRQAGMDTDLGAVPFEVFGLKSDATEDDKYSRLGEIQMEIGDLARRIDQRLAIRAGLETPVVEERMVETPEGMLRLLPSERRATLNVMKKSGGRRGEFPWQAAIDTGQFLRAMAVTEQTWLSTDGVAPILYAPLTALDYLNVIETDQGIYRWVKITQGANPAAPVARGAGRSSQASGDLETEPVETIITVISLPMEVVDDVPRFGMEIEQMMMWDVRHELMQQVFTGDGSSNNLTGLDSQLTGGNTAAGGANRIFHEELTNKVAELRTKGADVSAIFGDHVGYGKLFKELMTAGAAAGVIGGFQAGPGLAGNSGLNVAGAPYILTNGTNANTVLVYSRQASVLAMRRNAELRVSEDAEFPNYLLTLRAVVRAAHAVRRPEAAFKYTAVNTYTGRYSTP